MPTLLYFIVAFLSAADFSIAAYVLWKNPRRALSRAFFVFALGMALIGAGMVLLFITHHIVFDRLIFAGGFLMIFGLVLLSLKFPTDEPLQPRIWFIFLPLAALAASTPFGFLVQEVMFRPDGILQPVNGPGMPAFAAIIGAYVIFSIWQFWARYRRLSGTARMQMQYLALGAGVFAGVLFVCNVFLPALGVFELNLLGPASSLVFVVATAYAIVRHRLLDIRVVIQRGTIYLILATALVGFYLASVFAIGAFLDKSFDRNDAALLGIGFVAACLGVLTAVALEKVRLFDQMQRYSAELEARVRERTAALEDLQEEQRQTMIDISHRMQTPLTVVKSGLDFLKRRTDSPRHLEAFERSIDSISNFIYDLLRLARLGSRNDLSPEEPVNLSGLIAELAEYFGVLAEEQDVRFETHIEPGVMVAGVKEHLEELIINLASNALKYLDSGRQGQVGLTLRRDGPRAVLEVQDNGCGIAPEELDRIFERFYRSHRAAVGSAGKPPGTGLGLAIAKKIVDNHGGSIAVESEVGRGTKMQVRLPLEGG